MAHVDDCRCVAGSVRRDTEIAAFLGRESASDAGALVLGGDTSAGKSALLDAASASAEVSGYSVIRTAGVEAESGMGFAALTAVVHQVGTDAIAAVEPRFGPPATGRADRLADPASRSRPAVLTGVDGKWVG